MGIGGVPTMKSNMLDRTNYELPNLNDDEWNDLILSEFSKISEVDFDSLSTTDFESGSVPPSTKQGMIEETTVPDIGDGAIVKHPSDLFPSLGLSTMGTNTLLGGDPVNDFAGFEIPKLSDDINLMWEQYLTLDNELGSVPQLPVAPLLTDTEVVSSDGQNGVENNRLDKCNAGSCNSTSSFGM
ncbi:hypothetical protein Acr_05g0004380 [Actinidia rufa]|uniref:Uncharacterized protein n=1 Tax=Actinidia rufa TaxID=165716 RepID=A0A7J0ELI5_9ERIC|nr:hypothetical protein Acr_05g0004380 [Actinidia rufa]